MVAAARVPDPREDGDAVLPVGTDQPGIKTRGKTMDTISQQAANLTKEWETDPRWADIKRNYTAEDVIRLRGSITEEHTLARRTICGTEFTG